MEGRRGRNPVGVGNLLGVDPGQAFVPQANPGLWDALPLGWGALGQGMRAVAGSGGEEPCDERAEVLDGFCGPEVLRGHDGVVEGMVFRP